MIPVEEGGVSLALNTGGYFDATAETFVADTVTAGYAKGTSTNDGKKSRGPRNLVIDQVAHTLRSEGHDASEDGTGRGVPLVAYQCHGSNVGPMGVLRVGNGNEGGGVPFLFDDRNVTSRTNRQACRPGDAVPTMHEKAMAVAFQKRPGVRRLTPVECARLQGFPDDWLEGLSDSAAYRCLGNAVSVPVIEWIGRRMEAIA